MYIRVCSNPYVVRIDPNLARVLMLETVFNIYLYIFIYLYYTP